MTHDTHTGSLRKDLWASLTPRTIMFGRLFGLLGSSTHRFEVVAAMHKCGFTPQILETLPEAILTPLQDVISISQPNPPASWPKELLALVSRTDMNAVLRAGKTWRALGSEITVSAGPPCHHTQSLTSLRLLPMLQNGIFVCCVNT